MVVGCWLVVGCCWLVVGDNAYFVPETGIIVVILRVVGWWLVVGCWLVVGWLLVFRSNNVVPKRVL